MNSASPNIQAKNGIYNIHAGVPFADALANALLKETGADPMALARYRVLLPTRRACRIVRDSFLKITDGKPLLLPSLQPLGDVDEESLDLNLAGTGAANMALSLPPAMSPLQRQIILANRILQIKSFAQGADGAMNLAKALGQLMDQIYTENLNLSDLPALVQAEELAIHWKITTKFLEILSAFWPSILQEHGCIDAADRRNRLMVALARHWQNTPPTGPVIAAGTTGSIPGTAALLEAILNMPQGRVILPGLDAGIDDESWEALDDTHPQMTMKLLLQRIDIARTDVRPWPDYQKTSSSNDDTPPQLAQKIDTIRRDFVREVMRPAQTCHHWTSLTNHHALKEHIHRALEDVAVIEAPSLQDEAMSIAVILRDTLQTPQKTAALITPDRDLARRVSSICKRWAIDLDDSAGVPLSQTPTGIFLQLSARLCEKDLSAGTLLSLMKHGLFAPTFDDEIMNSAKSTTFLDKLILRRSPVPKTMTQLQKKLDKQENLDPNIASFMNAFVEACAPLHGLANETKLHEFATLLELHLHLSETLCPPATLWSDEAGRSAATFFADLREQAPHMPPVSLSAYINIITDLMSPVTVRPAYGTHPRLTILGQLEARMTQADTIILGGLNENIWPPKTQPDAWMSRPMRAQFGLPSPERSVGLSAHDFTQGLCHRHVFLTRAMKKDGAPTAPARWFARMKTVLMAMDCQDALPMNQPHLYRHYAQNLDVPQGAPAPFTRPAPTPPLTARPTTLYVTAIESWMRDPYALYARYILGLRKLDPLDAPYDAAVKGTLIHKIFEVFIREHMGANIDKPPPAAYEILLQTGHDIMTEILGPREDNPSLWGFWQPRFENIARWFIDKETTWRGFARPALQETIGSLTFTAKGTQTPFTLNAKADRIDRIKGNADNEHAIIDYKTGQSPSQPDILNGFSPQLTLEAIILNHGGFAQLLPHSKTGYLGFWEMGGSKAKPGAETIIKGNMDEITAQAFDGIEALVRVFADDQTPYYSLPRPDKAPRAEFQDYAHLARVQEWITLDDSEDAA